MLNRRARLATATLAAALLAVGGQAPASAVQSMTRADYEACQARDEQVFKAAIETVTFKALEAGVADFDYQAAVHDEWQRGAFDDLIDKRVDLAVAEVIDEASWAALMRSIASTEKAQELAVAVAERVYRSEVLKSAIEALSAGVGKAVGKSIDLAAANAADPIMQCLHVFLGARYGTAVAHAVTDHARNAFTPDLAKVGPDVSALAILREGSEGIAGAVVLLMRRQLSTMAQHVGRRIVGAVLSRLVSVVSGGIGAVLIAKDVWDFRHGVLPIVAEEMKSADTKQRVQAELAKALAEQIRENLRGIAVTTADRILDIWHDFRRAHAKVLDLAERYDGFRTFLDATRPDQLARLDEVTALVLAAEGEGGVLKRLEDRTLHYSVHVMPAPGLEIARETRSLATALSWSALAGSALPKVVEYEIHRRAKPSDFDATVLARLLALGDKLVVMRIAGVGPAARGILLEIDDGRLSSLARSLTEAEMETLARYLTGLEKSAGQRVLHAIAQTPAKMQVLARPSVRDAVLASRDQAAAVGMMLRADSGLDPTALSEDFQLALDGRVNPLLLWYKHPAAVAVLCTAAVLLLLFLRRLLPRRRRA